jgi:hypothetical protein
MLHKLQQQGYIHCDYKIGNIAWENNDTMNVILIDYDISTLQPLIMSNPKFVFDNDGNVLNMMVTSSFQPRYISNTRQNPVVARYLMPIERWDKYSTGGLVDIIKSLQLEFNSHEIIIEPPIGNISIIHTSNIIESLKLNSLRYEDIPTYGELYDIFKFLLEEKYIT